MITTFINQSKKMIIITLAIIVLLVIISTLFQPIFPIESSAQSKIAHFIAGAFFVWLFWHILEKNRQEHLVNPYWFIVGSIWGASGFFFVRWLFVLLGWKFGRTTGVYDTLLYMAYPDWDLLFSGWHRNMFFHSNITAIILIVVALMKKWTWLRDIGIGLAIGVASHLLWDIVSSANYPYTYIRHLTGYLGAIWAVSNAIIGMFFSYYVVSKSSQSP